MSATSKRILIVEDEWLIAEYLADHLTEAGYGVCGPFSNVAGALDFLKGSQVDAGCLDVSLGHEMSFPVAEALIEANIPFVFLSGYIETDLPDHLRGAMMLSKPVQFLRLDEALSAMVQDRT